VEGVLAIAAPACEVVDDPGAAHLLRGALDVSFSNSYEAAVLVANQLTPRGKKSQLRVETQGVELRGAEVRLTEDSGDLIDEYTVPTGGFVEPNSSEDPGFGSAMVTVIPSSVGRPLAEAVIRTGVSQIVIANIRVFGTTLGGVEVTSGEYSFPISLCAGCLISFPADALEAGVCVATEDVPDQTQCLPGQDVALDCRLCTGTHSACRMP
jgi:hypothetical protein